MKKTLFIIAACTLAAVSCQKEMAFDNEINSEGILTVTADIAQFGADTKTFIDGTAATIKPLWSANDSIKLFNKAGDAFVYVVKSADAGKSSAEFEPKDPTKTFSGEFACAYYPAANATAYVEGTGITANIPSEQEYVAATGANAGSFANGSFPMIGTGTLSTEGKNLNLTFKNVFGLVQLNFTGTETIKQIELVSNQSLSGVATIATDGTCAITEGGKFVTLTTTATTQPTLDAGTAKAFYIAVPADSTVSKIYVTTASATTRPLFKAKNITVSRSKIASLASSTLSGAGFTEVAAYQEASELLPVVVAGTVWAPVNCGYDTDHLCGKLYQWGRMDGCGYYKDASATTPAQDASDKVIQTAVAASWPDGGYTLSPAYDKFYTNAATTYDWYTSTGTQLSKWPMTASEAPSGSSRIGNPCPTAWRVPTRAELAALITQKVWGTSTVGTGEQYGYWFNGSSAASEGTGVFLPAAGYRGHQSTYYCRGEYGFYWSSSASASANNATKATCVRFDTSFAKCVNLNRACGYSVRCVQE